MMLVMGPHRVLHAGIRVVSILHGDVAVAVAALGAGDKGRAGVALMLLWLLRRETALVLVIFEAGGRLGL